MPEGAEAQAAPETRPAPRRQARGAARRDAIVRAAADLVLTGGPAAVTHRAVAARAGVPLAATTYYFTGLDDLLGAAGHVIVAGWAEHARDAARSVRHDPRRLPGGSRVAEPGVPAGAVDPAAAARATALHLVDAVLPAGGDTEVRGLYEHLVGAGRHPALARAYADGRDQLDAAVADLLDLLAVDHVRPELVVAVVDGAAVSALSEGREVRGLAQALVTDLLAGRATPPTAASDRR